MLCMSSAALFQYIPIVLNLTYNENKLYKTLEYWSNNKLNLYFSQKSLEIISPPHFVNNFSIKIFIMLYSINWSDLLAWLPSLLKILVNLCVAIAS